MIVTSGGKNIAPQPIENCLLTSQFIEQAVVIGDRRKFCSAIIVPSSAAVETWAQREGIVAEDYTSLLSNEKLMAFMQGEIDRLTESFASFERIKKFCLLPELFSQDGGELTPSLKIKRRIVEEKYAAEIEKMYRDD